jgi:hypothetical protein
MIDARDPMPGALLIGLSAVALVALLRRAGGAPRSVPALDVADDGPLVIDAGGPIELSGDFGLAAPATFVARVGSLLEGAVDKLKSLALPLGIRNKNPGNIRWIAASNRRWRGMVRDDGRGYAIFDTMDNGTRALGHQLMKYAGRGLDTVREIISTWAPPVENETSSYVTAVARALAIDADEKFDVGRRLVDLAWAIVIHENGKPFDSYRALDSEHNYTRADFERWVRLP